MRSPKARSERTSSLAAEKLVTRARRLSWSRDFVWFHIDDLNGLFDSLQPEGGEAPGRAVVESARLRIKTVMTAAVWNEDVCRKHVLAFLKEAIDRPEDAFGPAVFLLSLPSAVGTELNTWCKTLPVAVVETIKLVCPI